MDKPLPIITTTFVSIFLAELGDKTQLSTFAIAAESDHILEVFLGAGIALLLTSFLGVVAGKWLSSHLTPQLLNTLAGVCFLMLSAVLVWEVLS
ncbi:MAG: TMEM165/GDT1 family protein [Pseudanabaenaceae cyanobacterium]